MNFYDVTKDSLSAAKLLRRHSLRGFPLTRFKQINNVHTNNTQNFHYDFH